LIIKRYCYSSSVKEQRNCERARLDLSRGSWLLHFLNSFFPSNMLNIQRLAYLSEKQVQRDQRKVEDTAASNRPSEVEKDFTAFFDGDRMDACEKMQKVYGSKEDSEVGISYPRLACMIFEVKYSKCFSYIIALTLEYTRKSYPLPRGGTRSKVLVDGSPTLGCNKICRNCFVVNG